MSCQDINEHLSAYIDGMLDSSLVAQVEEHIASCPACKIEYEELAAAVDFVKQLPDILPPPGFHQELRSKLQSLPTPVVSGGGAGWLNKIKRGKWMGTLAAAAVICLTVGVTALWYDNSGGILNPVFHNQFARDASETGQLNKEKDQSLKIAADQTNNTSEEIATGLDAGNSAVNGTENMTEYIESRSMDRSTEQTAANPEQDTLDRTPRFFGLGDLAGQPSPSTDSTAKESAAGGQPDEMLSMREVPEATAQAPQPTLEKADEQNKIQATAAMPKVALEYDTTIWLGQNQTVDLAKMVTVHGGYVQEHSSDHAWKLRIPIAELETFLDALRSKGRIETITGGSNLTAEYEQITSQISKLQAREEALLLEPEPKTEDVLTELNEVQNQLTIQRVTLTKLDHDINYAVLNLLIK